MFGSSHHRVHATRPFPLAALTVSMVCVSAPQLLAQVCRATEVADEWVAHSGSLESNSVIVYTVGIADSAPAEMQQIVGDAVERWNRQRMASGIRLQIGGGHKADLWIGKRTPKPEADRLLQDMWGNRPGSLWDRFWQQYWEAYPRPRTTPNRIDLRWAGLLNRHPDAWASEVTGNCAAFRNDFTAVFYDAVNLGAWAPKNMEAAATIFTHEFGHFFGLENTLSLDEAQEPVPSIMVTAWMPGPDACRLYGERKITRQPTPADAETAGRCVRKHHKLFELPPQLPR